MCRQDLAKDFAEQSFDTKLESKSFGIKKCLGLIKLLENICFPGLFSREQDEGNGRIFQKRPEAQALYVTSPGAIVNIRAD